MKTIRSSSWKRTIYLFNSVYYRRSNNTDDFWLRHSIRTQGVDKASESRDDVLTDSIRMRADTPVGRAQWSQKIRLTSPSGIDHHISTRGTDTYRPAPTIRYSFWEQQDFRQIGPMQMLSAGLSISLEKTVGVSSALHAAMMDQAVCRESGYGSTDTGDHFAASWRLTLVCGDKSSRLISAPYTMYGNSEMFA